MEELDRVPLCERARADRLNVLWKEQRRQMTQLVEVPAWSLDFVVELRSALNLGPRAYMERAVEEIDKDVEEVGHIGGGTVERENPDRIVARIVGEVHEDGIATAHGRPKFIPHSRADEDDTDVATGLKALPQSSQEQNTGRRAAAYKFTKPQKRREYGRAQFAHSLALVNDDVARPLPICLDEVAQVPHKLGERRAAPVGLVVVCNRGLDAGELVEAALKDDLGVGCK